VYSLGVVLYEMLAGRPPFDGETPVAVAAAHVSREVPSLTDEVPDVPPHVALACKTALAKDPRLRPATAGAFRQMLEVPGQATDSPESSVDGSEGQPASAVAATAVLPAPDSTAVLPEAQGAATDDGQRHSTAEPPAAHQRNRSALILVSILAALMLLALLLSSVLGGDLSSPANAVKVEVPKVAGQGLAEAEQALRDQGFKVGDVKHVEGPADIVIRTDPPDGTVVAFGTTVTLYVGTPPETTDEEGGGGKGKDKGKGHGD
jgi:serine/threonine-protein kinase